MKWSLPARAGSLLGAFMCASLLGCHKLPEQGDAYATLRGLSETYCGVTDYYIASTTRVTSDHGAQVTQSIAAAAKDGRFRREMTQKAGDSALSVFDGTQEWTVFPARREYFVSAPGASASDAMFGDVQEHLCALGKAPLKRVRWLRSETTVMGARAVACDVVEISPDTTLWVDRADHVVIRELQAFAGGVQRWTDYSEVRLREGPPTGLFVAPVVSNLLLIPTPARGTMLRETWAARYRIAMEFLAAAKDAPGRFDDLGPLAKAAFEIGKIDEADRSARELLTLAPQFRQSWNYGNAIHDGHLVLGRVALRRGDLPAARRELLAAGMTPGSPQLDTSGPNMSLAKDLLELDQFDVVREYLRECEVFWKKPEILNAWIATIERKAVPDFGLNLRL